jgi:hypothetical protein
MLSKRLSGAALGAAVTIGLGLSVLPARAAYVVKLKQVNDDVVATGSGTIDLTDLHLDASNAQNSPGMQPNFPVIITGPAGDGLLDLYDSGLFVPTSFGTGGNFVGPINGSGDLVAAGYTLGVPAGYTSGSPLSSTSTWERATFESLGVTPGVYTWTWGSGANADSFTLDVHGHNASMNAANWSEGTSRRLDAVPEPSTWIMMLAGFAGLGFASWIKGRAVKAAG